MAHDQLSPRNIYVLASGAVEIDAVPVPTSSGATTVSEPKYVSPEAFAEGVFSGQQVSIAGDIYVLGFVFYEFLAGGKEFGKQFSQFRREQNDIEWLRWHANLTKKLQPLRQFRPDCPRQLESLLEQMLEKASASRMKTLEEAAVALKELASSCRKPESSRSPRGNPDAARPASGELPPGVPIKLSGAAAKLALAALAVILVAGGAVLGWRMLNNPATPPAQKPVNPPPPTPKAAPSPPDTAPSNIDQPRSIETATGTMMLVPKDEYPLGDPAAPVNVGPLYIDKYEVTNGLYRKFCSQPGHTCPAPPSWDAEYGNKPLRPAIGIS